MKKGKNFARKLFRANKRQKGQGMTEYIIIVVLIAIALIAAVKLFGTTLRDIWRGSTVKLQTEVLPSAGGGSGT